MRSSRSLAERLRDLRPGSAGPAPLADAVAEPAAPEPPAGSALERLEAKLLGAPGGGLSLKERLERLVSATARAPRPVLREARPAAVPLEELIAGKREENDRGEFFLVENSLHLDTWHGDVSLARFDLVQPEDLAVVGADPALAGRDVREAVFLDTETTGLAGGTGTAAFLIGVGWIEDDRFRVRQYFMRDYHEEAALLASLAEVLPRFSWIVTFNGKPFDVPLLESRYRMNRMRFPLAGLPHLDLLPPARRLWKQRLERCELQMLERALLNLERHGDVYGWEIPAAYFDYVRRRDGRAMVRVLEHNRLDVVSLAALLALACDWVRDGRAQDPRDVYSLARVYERAQVFERSESEYRRAAEAGPRDLRGAALMRLAARYRRTGRREEAAALWRQAAEAGEWRAWRELAVHHEHHARDPGAALAAVERAFRLAPAALGGEALSDLQHRRNRLLRKLGGRAALAR